ncbi:TcpD family membrane protein [Metabacillus niabensis]|uniref:TcpD family membrane protein n=1 Tax=Metabacillus niabensis TaxID=324854 RepID=UPI00119FCC21
MNKLYNLVASAPDLGASTNNTTVNNLANEILGVILVGLIVVFGGKLLAMFQQRQYAQLIVLFLIGGFAFWFVIDPNGFVTFMDKSISKLFGN